ncbi:MAG: hypothetical protein ABI673_08300 [Novosphingobium sp.]
MPAVARILSRFDRDQLASFIAVAIDLADAMDGDPEAEDDDPSGACDEDGINTLTGFTRGGGPGCEISDCDHAVDDKNCDDIGMDQEPDDGD